MPEIKCKQEYVDIDVYCGTCGRGLCNNTIVDETQTSFTVEACPNCMSIKDEEIKAEEEEIERLEIEIYNLKYGINV